MFEDSARAKTPVNGISNTRRGLWPIQSKGFLSVGAFDGRIG